MTLYEKILIAFVVVNVLAVVLIGHLALFIPNFNPYTLTFADGFFFHLIGALVTNLPMVAFLLFKKI